MIISLISIGVIIGMIYQIILLDIYVFTEDEFLEKIVITLETCSIILLMLLALKGYIS